MHLMPICEGFVHITIFQIAIFKVFKFTKYTTKLHKAFFNSFQFFINCINNSILRIFAEYFVDMRMYNFFENTKKTKHSLKNTTEMKVMWELIRNFF